MTTNTETPELHPVPGYDGYFVTRCGQVWSNRRGGLRRMSPTVTSSGHMYLKVAGNTIGVHVLVTLAFHGPKPSPAHVASHADDVPGNNSADNLSWETGQENVARAFANGRRGVSDVTLLIRERARAGASVAAIARDLGLPYSRVRNALGKKRHPIPLTETRVRRAVKAAGFDGDTLTTFRELLRFMGQHDEVFATIATWTL